ncbi:NAD(P)-binding protein [Aspergillus pseudotamarii]|uniref:NAD(P)-binding protein n=1 Tax=Aspergillus pseudotamarii TaxID=132259 RepID=A0A5N6T3G2_ASPPS|nr:NAD(P)-binding protein [Aspergillus pseudotamarii]KAE8140846.1 NAD(P)-binding protein [Aspergillus pseudotamarii]
MATSPIKTVLVIGASGNVEKPTVTLPADVNHIKTNYSEASLREIFKGHDAVISTVSSIVPSDALAIQTTFVDAAIAVGVKVFVPSEYGVDTSNCSAPQYIPFLGVKLQTLDYLKSKQDQILWIAICSGSMFDWGFNIPSFGGRNVPTRTVTIYNGGDVRYEATKLDQVGRAITKSLQNLELTKNQYIYVNSFKVIQNAILNALERVTGERFNVSKGNVEEFWQEGDAEWKEGQPLGVISMLSRAIYGKGGLAQYSVNKGLWNGKLGLEPENLEGFLRTYVAETKE